MNKPISDLPPDPIKILLVGTMNLGVSQAAMQNIITCWLQGHFPGAVCNKVSSKSEANSSVGAEHFTIQFEHKDK